MQTINVISTKYDGSAHWRYEPVLLEEADWGWLTFCDRGKTVQSHKGSWLNTHPFLRWHWRETWWDAMLLFDREGHWLEWYCNIITPPRREGGALRYHDLDLDVVWHRERGILIADADEFERHAVSMSYPRDVIQSAWQTAQTVRQMMLDRQWRFAADPNTLRLEDEMAAWATLLA
jgi:protein associated with RNAse G/E